MGWNQKPAASDLSHLPWQISINASVYVAREVNKLRIHYYFQLSGHDLIRAIETRDTPQQVSSYAKTPFKSITKKNRHGVHVDSIIYTYNQCQITTALVLMSKACSRCYQPLYESRSPFYGLASHSHPTAKCLPGWRLCSSPLTLWNIPPRSSSPQGSQLDIRPVMIEEDDSKKERRERVGCQMKGRSESVQPLWLEKRHLAMPVIQDWSRLESRQPPSKGHVLTWIDWLTPSIDQGSPKTPEVWKKMFIEVRLSTDEVGLRDKRGE